MTALSLMSFEIAQYFLPSYFINGFFLVALQICFGQELHTHHVSWQPWNPMYSMHIGNGITALVGLLHSMIGISAIMHFGNGGLLNREEFYLYWWSTTSLVHVLFFLKFKNKWAVFLSLPLVYNFSCLIIVCIVP